jgi:hypothetical protein
MLPPAERNQPPPITTTSSPTQSYASIGVATSALGLGEILERLPVLRTRRDNHRAQGPHSAVNRLGVRLLVIRKRRRAFRNHDFRADLLGLRVRTARELLA